MQPLVRQYSRVDIDRRRIRRIEAERPLMDDCEPKARWVRVSMCSLIPLPRSLGGVGRESADVWLVAGGASSEYSVPVGRGSESNRTSASVDAQTCCPCFGITSVEH